MNKRFRERMAETNKPANWKDAISLEFKAKFNYPKPRNKEYSMKNYFQQMEASGQFDAGLVCDKQFYKDDGNYPKVQKPAKEDE